jgi:hypothetical protein
MRAVDPRVRLVISQTAPRFLALESRSLSRAPSSFPCSTPFRPACRLRDRRCGHRMTRAAIPGSSVGADHAAQGTVLIEPSACLDPALRARRHRSAWSAPARTVSSTQSLLECVRRREWLVRDLSIDRGPRFGPRVGAPSEAHARTAPSGTGSSYLSGDAPKQCELRIGRDGGPFFYLKSRYSANEIAGDARAHNVRRCDRARRFRCDAASVIAAVACTPSLLAARSAAPGNACRPPCCRPAP